jgi:phosphatidylserine decarboxylase
MANGALWTLRHQYIDRSTGTPRTEELLGDPAIALLYAELWENGPALYSLLTAAWTSRLLGLLHYNAVLGARTRRLVAYLTKCGVDIRECVEPPERLDTPRKLFERQIRYWECRPMPEAPDIVVSPSDARVVVGSLRETSALCLKGKFFDLAELLGGQGEPFAPRFAGGDFAVLRLTPDKYHYNHVPVAGRVRDIFEVAGAYHACNPAAVVSVVTPYSKNRRVVTLIESDVPGGTQVGLVAMIEVAALMVGDIVQRYSPERYHPLRPIGPGTFLHKGAPKSLFRPGGSTVVLLFEPGRIVFAGDLVANQARPGVVSRYSIGFGRPLVETDVRVRSLLARAAASRERQGHARLLQEACHG